MAVRHQPREEGKILMICGGGVRLRPADICERPRVSVVIPCYNYGRYLEGCVRSALEQPGIDVDVTVIDDASLDNSHEVAQLLAKADSRVSIIRHVANRGHLATANEALQAASGEYIVKLDADDLLAPGSLVRSAALLEHHRSVAFVYGWPEFFEGEPPQVDIGAPKSWTIWSGDKWVDRMLRRTHNVIAQPEVMIRRSALLRVGGYRADLPWAEDYNLWLRLATVGAVGRINGCTQGLYRVHAQSFQRSSRDLRLSDLLGRVSATRRYLEETQGASQARMRLALASLARDTRRLLAARRDERDAPESTLAEYLRIAMELERESGSHPRRGPLVWDGEVGRLSRHIFEALRWRHWRATGV